MSFDIPWWWKLIGAAVLLAALVAGKKAYDAHLVGQGDAAGYARANREWVAKEAKIEAAAILEAKADTLKAQQATAALQLKFDQLGDVQQKARIDHENNIRIAVAGALAGTERLSIATAAGPGGSLSEVGTAEGAAVGAGAAPEARADILPGTAAVILRIAGDYGQLVRDYNAVVERFDAARISCNSE